MLSCSAQRRQKKKKSTVGARIVSVSRSVDVNEGVLFVCLFWFSLPFWWRRWWWWCHTFGSMFLAITRVIPFFLWKWSILCVKITPHPLMLCNIVYSRMIAVEKFRWSYLLLSLMPFFPPPWSRLSFARLVFHSVRSAETLRVCVVFDL